MTRQREPKEPSSAASEVIVRLQVELDKAHMDEIEHLMNVGSMKTKKEFLKNAIALMKWAISEKVKGRALVSFDEHENIPRRELSMPFLESAADHCEPNAPRSENRGSRGSSMTLRPLHDHVLIKRIDEAEHVREGIIVPDDAKAATQQDVVLGKGRHLEAGHLSPLEIETGDRILFGKYSGTEIKLDDQEYLILREDDILGIISGAARKMKRA